MSVNLVPIIQAVATDYAYEIRTRQGVIGEMNRCVDGWVVSFSVGHTGTDRKVEGVFPDLDSATEWVMTDGWQDFILASAELQKSRNAARPHQSVRSGRSFQGCRYIR